MPAHGGQPLPDALPGAVPAAVRVGQVDRDARVGRGPGRRRPRPGQDQAVLALEEPLAAHAAGGPALGRVLLGTGSP